MEITVIGMGLSFDDLTRHHLSLIETADILAGGQRHLNCFPDFNGEKVTVTKDLKGLVHTLQKKIKQNKKVVVLASGDPLFFGIGSYLIHKFGKDQVQIFPNISAVAGAFSRINDSWHDAKVISLHGRPFTDAHLNMFRNYNKLAILTDKVNTPAAIYEQISSAGMTDFNICVLQCMGDTSEKIEWFSPTDPVTKAFDDPNIMIFIRAEVSLKGASPAVYPGMAEDLFHHEGGLITKSEIRVVSLAKLLLEKNSIMWDLGAGSGSVSVEASFYIKTGQIYAVEKNIHRINHIVENKHRFQVSHLNVVHGVLPDVLDQLPDPDRIFIGGGGVHLPQIITAGAQRLLAGGIIVINTVLLKSMADSIETLEQLGFDVDIIQMQISNGHLMPWNRMLKSQNPVWIIWGKK